MIGAEHKELTSWKAIAEYLGVSVRTAHTYHKERGLPVHHLPGPKGRVWASADDLDRWRLQDECDSEDNQNHKAPEPMGEASIVAESAGQGSAFGSRKVLIGFSLAAAIFLATGVCSYRASSVFRMADFRVNGNFLTVFNDQGRDLWKHRFPEILAEDRYVSVERGQTAWIGNLNSKQRLLFVTYPVAIARTGNDLLCFSRGGQIEWRFRPGRQVRDAGGSTMAPPYFIHGVQVFQKGRPEMTRILVSSHHYLEQADQVAVLDASGRLLAEYWHPGQLLHLGRAELAGDGQDEALLGGVNNGNHQATLVVLDPWALQGLTTPSFMADDRFRIVGMRPAKEVAVVLFPRSAIAGHEPYTRLAELRVLPDRIVAIVSESQSEAGPTIIYELDNRLRVLAVTFNDTAVRAYRAMKGPELDHTALEAEISRLKAGVIVRSDRRN